MVKKFNKYFQLKMDKNSYKFYIKVWNCLKLFFRNINVVYRKIRKNYMIKVQDIMVILLLYTKFNNKEF